MKKLLSILLVLTMVFSLAVPTFAAEANTTITIVSTNDTHARLAGNDKDQIGWAKVAAKIAELKASGENVLVMDAGDTLHGQTLVTVPKGESAINVMNLMGYNYMVPGNHDFNYGQERLVELASKANFKVLSANVVKENGETLLPANDMVEVDGVKVGIFGLSTPETAVKTNPLNVKGLTFRNPVEVAKEQVKELEEKGADVIVLLCHLGIDEESKGNRSYDVRDNVEGIDLIVDGHSHSTMEDIVQAEGKTPIVSSGQYGETLGVSTIKVENGKVTVDVAALSYDEITTADENVAAAIKAAQDEIAPLLNKVVGKTEVELNGERANVRGGETNLSKLAADAMRKGTGADVAFTNGGGVRASIKVGDITVNDVITVFPFGNYVVTLEITGENLVKALEHGTASYPELAGSFPQVSGVEYTLVTGNEAGNRIKDVKVGGKDLVMDQTYVLATNDFMAVGGDGYTMFGESKKINEYSGLDEILIDYITELGVLTAENTTTPDRLHVVEKEVVEQVYTVKAGDMLWKIARQFNTTYQHLAEVNNIKNPHLIFVGQQIVIK